MNFWQSICNWFDPTQSTCAPIYTTTEVHFTYINPATGLPMAGDGCSGIDVGGSPFGLDIHQNSYMHNSTGGDLFSNDQNLT